MEPLTLTLIFLSAYFCAVVFSRLTGLSVIVGFLLIGALIATVIPDLLELRHSIELLTEIGVAFLLFEVGSHLPLKKLIGSWRQFFITGPAQVVCTSILFYFALIALGVDALQAKVIAFALSLSSTAVVMQIFKDHGEVGSPVSERAISTLVFQDIAAVLGLSILGSFQMNTGSQDFPALEMIKLLGILVAVLSVGSLLVRPFFKFVIAVKAQEIITPAALLYVLALAWGANYLGLSYSLGAFLGGVSIAGTRYSALVTSELQPFRALLLALFFVSIGLSIESTYVTENIFQIISLTFGFMALKTVSNFIAFKLTSSREEPSIYISGVLAQGSEFTFIVVLTAMQAGLLQTEVAQLIQASVALSLMIAPLFAGWGCYLARSCSVPVEADSEINIDGAEVIIGEFDEVAWQLANALERAGIQYRGHDRDLERIAYATSRGYKVHFSNADRPLTLSKASTGQARAVISLIEDETTSSFLIDGLQKMAPNVPILAATKDIKLFEKLSSKGLSATFIKNSQTARLIFTELIRNYGDSRSEIEGRLKDWNWGEETATAA